MRLTLFGGLMAISSVVASQLALAQTALESEFTFQGALKLGGADVDEPVDFIFTLWRDEFSTNPADAINAPEFRFGASIVDGQFSETLNFGIDPFDGRALWLEIEVRLSAVGGAYTTLSPRQAITAAPYALALRGLRTEESGEGVNPDAWNIIAGHPQNSIASGISGAVVSGGGDNELGFNYFNEARQSFCTVSGGRANIAGGTSSGEDATVGGGRNNEASGSSSTIGGGRFNITSASDCTIAGGFGNEATGFAATISGGGSNDARGGYATIAGGNSNQAGGDFSFAAGQRAIVRDATQSGDQNGDEGTFVWADQSSTQGVTSTGPNQFLIRAAGGVGIGTAAPSSQLSVAGDADFSGPVDIGAGNQNMQLWVDGANRSRIDAGPGGNSALCLNNGGGNVGVGTIGPLGALHVRRDNGNPSITFENGGDTSSNRGVSIDFRHSNGVGAQIRSQRASGDTDGMYMVFETEGVGGARLERMRIASHGNVGIGTTTPSFGRLEVRQDTDAADKGIAINSSNNNSLRLWVDGDDVRRIDAGASGAATLALNNGGGRVGVGTTTPSFGRLEVQQFADDAGEGIAVTNTNNNSVRLWVDGDDVRRIDAGASGTQILSLNDGGGRVGIGTTSPSQSLHVVGNICATGSVGACSDARFKENVASLGHALAILGKLRGVSFDWKREDYPDRRFSDERQVGFIAQEIAEVLPEVVNKGSDGYYAVDYGRLTPVLVEAVKELHGQFDAELQQRDAENASLRAEIETLKRAVAALENRGR